MSELDELYQQVILDHNKRPRNFRALEDADHSAEGFNPLCGDQIKLYVKISDDSITDIAFQGSGCAISKASASMMTESVKGKSTSQVAEVFDKVHKMLTRSPGSEFDRVAIGKLAAFAGVVEFPVRVKCATLAWHTLKAALENKHEAISTEQI